MMALYSRRQPSFGAHTTRQISHAAALKPIFVPDAGKYLQLQSIPEDTPMAFIGNTRANLGAFVRAILDQPVRTRGGRTVFVYNGMTTLGGLQMWAKAHGVKAQYVQIPKEA